MMLKMLPSWPDAFLVPMEDVVYSLELFPENCWTFTRMLFPSYPTIEGIYIVHFIF
jgi:hypothetical protein